MYKFWHLKSISHLHSWPMTQYLISARDQRLWNTVVDQGSLLHDLLPPTRTRMLCNRGHDYLLPKVRTERYESAQNLATAHINIVARIFWSCKKKSGRSSIAVLRKIRRYLPIGEHILYYNAMIRQIMLYGSIIWTLCSSENVNKVLKLQKRAAPCVI
jgi:hypothetical protein